RPAPQSGDRGERGEMCGPLVADDVDRGGQVQLLAQIEDQVELRLLSVRHGQVDHLLFSFQRSMMYETTSSWSPMTVRSLSSEPRWTHSGSVSRCLSIMSRSDAASVEPDAEWCWCSRARSTAA